MAAVFEELSDDKGIIDLWVNGEHLIKNRKKVKK